MEDTALTTVESTTFAHHEATIERGLKTFYEVGSALAAIHDHKLYREQYSTFEEYCQARWNLSRPRAYQLIEAAEVTNSLSTIVDILPANEAQARPLASVAPEQRAAVWQQAVDTAPAGKMTGAHVSRVAVEYTHTTHRAISIERIPVDDYDTAPDEPPAVQVEDDDESLSPYEESIAARYDDAPPPDDDTPTPAPVPDRQPTVLAVVESVAPPRAVHQLLTSSESNEWYTPAAYIEAARLVMGAIDLDPASNAIAQQTVKAGRFFTIDDDGFHQEWGSAFVPVSVWLNPPYGKTGNESNAARWSRKLLDAYRAGTVAESVLLVNANTGDGWFAPLKQFAVCFPDARIRFYSPTGEPTQPMHSNALVYFGPNVATFVRVFSQFGTVMGRLLEERGRVVSAGLGAAL